MILLVIIGLVALIILWLTATSARTASGIIWGGIFGGSVMAGGCLLLKFFAGIDQATGGTGDMQKMLKLVVIVGPVVLFCYFIFAFVRLNEGKNDRSNQ